MVCTYAQLKAHSSGKEYWHFNTHFDHIGKIARNESAKLIVNQINQKTKKGSAVVITGDFNAQAEEAPIHTIKKDFKDPLDALAFD